MKKISHCSLVGDYSCDAPRVRYAEGGRLLQLRFAPSPAMQWNSEQFFDRSPRGRCKGFSTSSRRRMLCRLNEVSKEAYKPYFVTATLPDDVFDDDAARFAKTAKVWLDKFVKRLVRVSPFACGFWRIEWKARKSGVHEGKLFPHFHMLVWGMAERELDAIYECDEETGVITGEKQNWEAVVNMADSQFTLQLVQKLVGSTRADPGARTGTVTCYSLIGQFQFKGSARYVDYCSNLHSYLAAEAVDANHPLAIRARQMSFQDWGSLAWFYCVGSDNRDHITAGFRVERVKSWGGVMAYAAKYLGKPGEEFLSEIEFGRSWGIFNRKHMPWAKIIELNLDGEVGVCLRRVARHYLDRVCKKRRQRPYGVTLFSNDVAQWSKLWARPPDNPF